MSQERRQQPGEVLLNREEVRTLQRVLQQALNKATDLPEYWAMGVREDVSLLQDRIDAATADSLVTS